MRNFFLGGGDGGGVHILFQKPSEANLVVSDLGIMGKQVSSNTVILKEFTHN